MPHQGVGRERRHARARARGRARVRLARALPLAPRARPRPSESERDDDDNDDARALALIRYAELKRASAASASELSAARARVHDLRALETIARASVERRAARHALGFTRAARARSVGYARQYHKLRLVLLARRDDGSPFGRGGLPLDLIVSFLVPWRVEAARVETAADVAERARAQTEAAPGP